MSRKFTLFFVAVLCLISINSIGQVAKTQVIAMYASIENAVITIHWTDADFAGSYLLYKRQDLGNDSWGNPIATVNGTIHQYDDKSIEPGIAYEYLLQKVQSTTLVGVGNLFTGIDVEPNGNLGGLILLIDSQYTTTLSPKIEQLVSDLTNESYIVHTLYAGRKESVVDVKKRIVDEWTTSGQNIHTLFILGHVPVPYSGDFTGAGVPPPDGHIEGSGDHTGAWPADGYYGDMDGEWKDNFVVNTSGGSNRNHNIPSDGKFDHCKFPSSIELMVGRVDFYDMPQFKEGEEALMSDYLDRNHAYRTGNWIVTPRALIDNNFTGFNIASTGYLTASAFLEADSIYDSRDYFTELRKRDYLISYGCGPGSYTTCGGIGSTTDFTKEKLNNPFTILAGSFFGDWDVTNNFLRAPLCNSALACFWGGIPKWYLHHGALDYSIGYATRLTQNNVDFYFSGNFNFSQNSVHIALMGDPTLRILMGKNPVTPASDLNISVVSNHVNLKWTASAGNVAGYNIYRSDKDNGYIKINETMVTTNQFVDNVTWRSGDYTYLVRPVALVELQMSEVMTLGAGVSGDIKLTNSLPEIGNLSFKAFPNPAKGFVNIKRSDANSQSQVTIYDMQGRSLQMTKMGQGISELSLDISELQSGLYMIELKEPNGATLLQKISKI